MAAVEAKLCELLDQLDLNPNDYAIQSEILKFLEEKNLRKSNVVMKTGEKVLTTNVDQIGDGVWRLQERVFLAALDCKRFDRALRMLQQLGRKFGLESSRIVNLRGLYYEATEKWDQAMEEYQEVLKGDNTNKMASSRIVCCYIGQHKLTQAMKSLRDHLNTFQSDIDAWKTLADLYLQTMQYSHAKFCIEEILAQQPADWRIHLLYAETLYTLGEYENAKKYFCECLNQNSENLRAALGLDKCLRKLSEKDLAAHEYLHEKCKERILKKVKYNKPEILRYFKEREVPGTKSETSI